MKKRSIVVLAIFLFVIHGLILGAADNTESQIPKKALKLVKKAEKSIKEKKYDKALEFYSKAIEFAPEYGAAYRGLGRLQAAQKKFDEAVVNLDKAAQLDPGDVKAKSFLARALFELGRQNVSQRQYQKANEYLIKIVGIPGIETAEEKINREVLFQIGLNYSRLNKFDKSNQYYIKLAELPGLDTADKKLLMQTLYQVGINYYNLKKAGESNEYFIKLLKYPELETDFPQLYISVYYLVGLNATLQSDHKQAIEYLSKFLELGEASAAHSQLLPLANLFLGSSHMAIMQKEAEEIKNDKGKDKKKRIAELAQGKKEIATYLSKAIQLQSDLELAYMHLGNYYYYADDLDNAIATYQKLVDKFPASQDIATYKQFVKDIKKEKEAQKKKK